MRPTRWIYTVPLRLRSFFRRRDVDHELDEELRFHIEQKAAQYAARGLSPAEARRRAMLDMNGIERSKEECRDMRKVGWVQDLLQDVQYGARVLRKSPGFTVVAVLTLGLGIGSSTAIFSVVNPILFASLPYPNPGRLVMVWERGNGGGQRLPNFADYVGLTERSHSFEAVAAMKPWQPTITGSDEPERLEGQRVSAPFFRVLGTAPVIGRDFQPADDVFRAVEIIETKPHSS